MATGSSRNSSRKEILNFDENNTEAEIKTRMNWSKEEWKERGEHDTSLNKLINSLRFWKKKIGNANNDRVTIITLYNTNNFARIDIVEIVNAIEMLNPDIIIEGFSEFRNPRYLAIHFKTENMKLLVENNLRKVGHDNVIFMSWAAQVETHNVRIHWLPKDHNLDNIIALINLYMEILEISKGSITLMSGKKFETGLLIFKSKLKTGMSLEMIPHTAVIDGFEVLITIYGRKPLCLTCDSLGHISVNCPTPYCNTCKRLQPKKHVCVAGDNYISYAQKVKTGGNGEDIEPFFEGRDQQSLLEPDIETVITPEPLQTKRKTKGFFVAGPHCRIVKNDSLEPNKTNTGKAQKTSEQVTESDSNSEEDTVQVGIKNEISQNTTPKKDVLTNMSEHLNALQNFELPNLQETREMLIKHNKSQKPIQLQVNNKPEKMQTEVVSLKRKLHKPVPLLDPNSSNKGTRKTYGSNSQILKSQNAISNNLFDALAEENEQNSD